MNDQAKRNINQILVNVVSALAVATLLYFFSKKTETKPEIRKISI